MPVAAARHGALRRTRSAPSSPRLAAAAAGDRSGDEDRQRTSTPLQYVRRRSGLRGFLGDCDAAEEGEKGDKKTLKEIRGALLVVASLLASVTYQAGMSPPGGLWQDTTAEGSPKPHRAGDPVLQNTDGVRFQLFNVFNTMAFSTAVGVIMHLITESMVAGWRGGSPTARRFGSLVGLGSLKSMKYMMILSLLYLAVAFAGGSCRNWWCSLGALFSPLLYFVTCVALDLLYSMYTRRQERKLVPAPSARQVEVAVDYINHDVRIPL